MIFSRLYIQECLNQIRELSSDMKHTLRQLNSNDGNNVIAAMWEVVVSAELLKLGKIELEKCFKGEYQVDKKPDILFSNNEIEFLADIKCVSDQDKHKNNPVNELRKLMDNRLLELGFSNFSYHIEIKDTVKSNRYGPQIELKIPKNIEFLFHKSIKSQLNKDQLKYKFRNLENYDGLCFELEIKFNAQFSSSHHTNYTVSKDERATTLYTKLEKNKKQIDFFGGYKGFIICDADYALFQHKNYSDRERYATFKSTCVKYLREKDKIDFIIGIWISTNKNNYSDVAYKVNYEVICLHNDEVKEKLNIIFSNVVKSFPEVIRTPLNSKKLISFNKYGNGSIGCKESLDHEGTIYGFSTREIQAILAGERSLNGQKKYNFFPNIAVEKLVRIWIDQEAYKEDYCFNLKCADKHINVTDEMIKDYDVFVPVRNFLDLMAGRVQFNFFEKEFLIGNTLEFNVFKENYDNGFLIKNAVLIGHDKIGFKFDNIKSPLISDFV